MITLTNPDDGKKHEMDGPAMAELREALKAAQEAGRSELVFRAMRMDTETALKVLAADV